MSLREPPFTVGIEEEYLLVDRRSGDVANDPPPELLERCGERGGGQISPEFLRCQVEVGTRVARSMVEARADLARLRRLIVEVAADYDLAPIAASSHPFARVTSQMRDSSVGNRDDGRTSHQIFVASSMMPHPVRMPTDRWNSEYEAKSGGMPVLGRLSKTDSL